jgi:hypothetical protein
MSARGCKDWRRNRDTAMPTHLNAGRVAHRGGAIAPNGRGRTSVSIRRHRQRTTRLPTRRQRPGILAGALRYPRRGAGSGLGSQGAVTLTRCSRSSRLKTCPGCCMQCSSNSNSRGGQFEHLVVQMCLSCQAVKRQGAGHHGGASGPGAHGNSLGLAQRGPQSHQRFRDREGLCEMVVGAHLHAQDAMQACFCQRIVGPISLPTAPPTLPAPG